MTLQIWNGNAQTFVPFALRQKHGLRHNSYVHMYGCATSRAALVRMIQAWSGSQGSLDSYIKDYWSKGCWGDSMNGIDPEPGLWVQWSQGTKPERVWPAPGVSARDHQSFCEQTPRDCGKGGE